MPSGRFDLYANQEYATDILFPDFSISILYFIVNLAASHIYSVHVSCDNHVSCKKYFQNQEFFYFMRNLIKA